MEIKFENILQIWKQKTRNKCPVIPLISGRQILKPHLQKSKEIIHTKIFLLTLIVAKRKYKIHIYFITLLKFSHKYNFQDFFLYETIINYEPINFWFLIKYYVGKVIIGFFFLPWLFQDQLAILMLKIILCWLNYFLHITSIRLSFKVTVV